MVVSDKWNMDKCPFCGNPTIITETNPDMADVSCSRCNGLGGTLVKLPPPTTEQIAKNKEWLDKKFLPILDENGNVIPNAYQSRGTLVNLSTDENE
jgi:hypothetical protein